MKNDGQPRPRRTFIKGITAATAGLALGPCPTAFAAGNPAQVPRRKLGRTGEMLSVMGIGGHTLALASNEEESIRIVHQAIDAGINCMDNAWDYNDGRSEVIMGRALKGGWRERTFLMTKVCAHIRGQTKLACMEMLEESLKRLQTDHLDLWMLHELGTLEQVEAAWKPGGPMEALAEARQQGKVRYVGFTGHQRAEIHLAMLKHEFDFDAVLMPINAFEDNRAGFRTEVLPELIRRQIGVLGMKSFGGTPARILRQGRFTAEQLLRFSLSQPITTQIVGMRSLQNLRDNLELVRNFTPMSKDEMESMLASCSGLDTRFYCHYQQPGYHDGNAVVG